MKAINNYKLFIEELHFIFSIFEECNKDECLEYCSISLLKKQEAKTMHYANRIAGEIKEELIGDGKEAEFKGRLKTAFWELTGGSNTREYYFPSFESLNNSRVQTLSVIYGDEAADVIEVVKTISQWANYMVQNVCNMFDEVCKFVGYAPESQQGEQQPQQKDLHYYCLKAVEKGYLVKVDGGYKKATWSKALLAYFLKYFLNTDGTFPDKEYCVMFGESRLSKAADQLSINKNGDGKPRGYEIVDELLQE